MKVFDFLPVEEEFDVVDVLVNRYTNSVSEIVRHYKKYKESGYCYEGGQRISAADYQRAKELYEKQVRYGVPFSKTRPQKTEEE